MNHKDPFSTMPNNSTITSNNIAASLGNASKITTVLANYGVTASEDDSENTKFDGLSKISHKTNIPDSINTDSSNSNTTSIINTNESAREISYTDTKVIGNGSFGVVFQAKLVDTGELVAIKKVLQDKRFKNRELQIMKELNHCNIVKLRYYFYCTGEKKDDIFLNLVLEYVPETVYRVARHYSKSKLTLPLLYVKLYLYQLFRALAYIHYKGICHRDIKPQNLLLDPETSVLKLCDFGSAKQLVRGEPNVSYICSRYYRAPELIFGATDYSWNIDVWSAGCVLAELMLGHPLFPGDSGVDQLVEIIKILGTPSREQIREMNPNYTEFKFPQIKPHPWTKVFRNRVPPEAIELVSKLLEYIPSRRLSPLQACAHAFFDELRNPATKLPNGAPLPPLFNFTPLELSIAPSLNAILVPSHYVPTSTTIVYKGDNVATASNTLNRLGPASNTTTSTGTVGSIPAPSPNITGKDESQTTHGNNDVGGSKQLTRNDDCPAPSTQTSEPIKTPSAPDGGLEAPPNHS